VRRSFFLALASACLCTSLSAQAPLTKILSSELERNYTVLKQKGNPAPYFMGYEASDVDANVIVASDGAITADTHRKARLLDITVRVGTPQFDNYRRVNGQIPRFTVTTPLPLDDDEAAVRRSAWLSTDRVYRNSSQRLIQIKADEKLRAAAQDDSDDFSREDPQKAFLPTSPLQFNTAEWTARLRKLSSDFKKYPGALNSDISLEAERVAKTLVTTEGTELEYGRLFSRIMVSTRGKAADGMDLTTMEDFQTDDPSRLPSDAQILTAVEKAGKSLQDLLHAPPADPFVGPAILSGRAAGVFFHEIFGHRIEGHRQKDESEGQTFTKSVGMPILPSFLSVVFDPTVHDFEGTMLNGYYAYDDEGVKARRVVVVDSGVLKTFLMSRSPIKGFPQSNGHGRREPGTEVVSRQSNLFVESSKRVSDQELRRMLIEEVKKQNKPYGLFFDQVTGGYTTTARRGLQAFTVIPLVVYRVYPDGRPDELIRGVDIVGTPLASFSNILATSEKRDVFNGICGAESGNVPVSAIAPALLVSSIEIQRKERSQDTPPYLGRPEARQ